MTDSTSSSASTPETVRADDLYDVVEKPSKRKQDKRKLIAAATATVTVHREYRKRGSSEPNIRLPKTTHFALVTVDPISPAPARAATEPVVSYHSAAGENTPLVNSDQFLGSDEPHSLHFDDEVPPVPQVVGACQRIREGYQAYKRWTRRTSRSAFMIPVYIGLMAFSCHACFMGFHSDCKWMEGLPEAYVFMGLSSLFVELARFNSVLQKTCYPHSTIPSPERCNVLTFGIGIAMFSLSYFLEILSFFLKTTEPSTTLGSDTYCDPSFYKYVKCTNGIIPVVIFVMAVLHGPSC